MVLATAYLPPVWYFSQLLSDEKITIEASEHFIKQSIRNRCHILSPNGIQTLVVPVVQKGRSKFAVRDIRIANDLPWQRQHFRSLEAAYRRSAFFEFYQDDLIPFYEKKYDFLIEFNSDLLQMIVSQLGLDKKVSYTSEFSPYDKAGDIRKSCDAGSPVISGKEKIYPQVFEYKSGFVPGLSMADLLFSMGPAAVEYL